MMVTGQGSNSYTLMQIPAMYGGIGYQAGQSPAMPMVQA